MSLDSPKGEGDTTVEVRVDGKEVEEPETTEDVCELRESVWCAETRAGRTDEKESFAGSDPRA